MQELLVYPLQGEEILLKKKKLYKKLSKQTKLIEKRIAILSGSTIGHVKDVLDLFLLQNGIRPIFYEGTYNRFYEDIVFEIEPIKDFQPDFVYIHTSCKNIITTPEIGDDENIVNYKINTEILRFKTVWDTIFTELNCAVIQNNFEFPKIRPLGNFDTYSHIGHVNYITRLNMTLYKYAQTNNNFYINDINYISAEYGLGKWHNSQHWHMYKYAMDLNAIPLLCHNIANIIKSALGKNKKAIIIDLDNTLWGGVIGDDGAEHIEIGQETPIGEMYAAFQQYLKTLKNRGIILAVCSKNNLETAKSAFNNPNMVLKLDDFIAFKANWNDKASNILEISKELNLSPDSFIFIDDNPAEREIVLQNIPGIAVNYANEAETFIDFIDKNGFFEATSITSDDLKRNEYYKENVVRVAESAQFTDYDAYLNSLNMTYTFGNFSEDNLERVVQLINKTNQFNLTSKRMTEAEIRSIMNDTHLNITASLKDKFGDNGLISVFSGFVNRDILSIEIWLMSCRVFKRNVEYKLFDYILQWCNQNNIKEIHGHYISTEKNALVSTFYKQLGFMQDEKNIWIYRIGRL